MRMNTKRNRNRRGSALLICTLAAAVLSMATIAILRSQQHAVRRVDAARASLSAKMTADGLMQRAVALLRTDPSLATTFNDRRFRNSPAFVVVQPLSVDESRVSVYLYAGSTVPAVSRVINVGGL